MEMEAENSVNYFENLPSPVFSNIFKYLSIAELKISSLVCWEWYNEIALAWKHRIWIRIVMKLLHFRYEELHGAFENSKRYFENIILDFDKYNHFGYPKMPDIDKFSSNKLVETINNRETLKYKNHIKHVHSMASNWRTEMFMEIFSSFDEGLISLHLDSNDKYSRSNWRDKLEFQNQQKIIAGKIFGRLQELKIGYEVPNLLHNLNIDTLCFNLTDFIIEFFRDDFPFVENILKRNTSLQHLSLFSRKCNGLNAEQRSKVYMSTQNYRIRSFSGTVLSDFNHSDLKLMQQNWSFLEKLDVRFDVRDGGPKISTGCLYHHLWDMGNLKELNITKFQKNIYYTYMIRDDDTKKLKKIRRQMNKPAPEDWGSYPFTKNKSLIKTTYEGSTIANRLLQALVDSTPNIRVLSFKDVDFEIDAVTLMESLSTLRFLEHLVLEDVIVNNDDNDENTEIHKVFLNQLKEMKILYKNKNSNDKSNIMFSKLFHVLYAPNLEKLLLHTVTYTLDKVIIDQIPLQCPNVKVLGIYSHYIFEYSFDEILIKYDQLSEFHFIMPRDYSRTSEIEQISYIAMKFRLMLDLDSFLYKSKKLTSVEIVYISSTAIQCGWHYNSKALKSFLEMMCKQKNLDLEMKEIQEPGADLSKYTLRGCGKTMDFIVGPW